MSRCEVDERNVEVASLQTGGGVTAFLVFFMQAGFMFLEAGFARMYSVGVSDFTGLFYGGGANQLIAQVIGSAVVTAATFGIAMVLMYLTQQARCRARIARDDPENEDAFR